MMTNGLVGRRNQRLGVRTGVRPTINKWDDDVCDEDDEDDSLWMPTVQPTDTVNAQQRVYRLPPPEPRRKRAEEGKDWRTMQFMQKGSRKR